MKSQNKNYLNATINQYTLINEKIYYYAKIRDLCNLEDWTFRARYSELKKIHEGFHRLKIKHLPDFPKKKYFSTTNNDPDAIEMRRKELETYLNNLFDARGISPKNIFHRKSVLRLILKETDIVLCIESISIIKVNESPKKQRWRESWGKDNWKEGQNEGKFEAKAAYSIRKIRDTIPV